MTLLARFPPRSRQMLPQKEEFEAAYIKKVSFIRANSSFFVTIYNFYVIFFDPLCVIQKM